MRRQLLLILPILAAVLSSLAFVVANLVSAQNMTGNETMMMTNTTNATMGGNMTRNMSNATGIPSSSEEL
jgi:hypothetical protein